MATNRRNDVKNGRKKIRFGSRGPTELGTVLSELVALRGIGRVQGNAELNAVWKNAVGEPYAEMTKVMNLRNGTLQVAVGNAMLLNELVAFRRDELLKRLQTDYPGKKIRDLKFKLKGDLKPNN